MSAQTPRRSKARSSSDAGVQLVVLLRGINVGGKNKLPMAQLAAVLEEQGCTDVRTYIQSGNAVVRVATKSAATLAQRTSKAIAARCKLAVPVITRTAPQWRAVLAVPHAFQRHDPAHLHVVFLAQEPTPTNVDALDPDRSPGDTFVVREREIYLHLPNGVARTKLSNVYFDRALATVSTVRNWRTVQTLAAMLDDA